MIFKLIRYGLIISLTFFWFFTKAQISSGGAPLFKTGKVKSELSTIYLPRFEKASMIEGYEQAKGKSFLKHAKYAYQYNVSYNSQNSGKWQIINDGRRVWRISISSPGAYSLGLIFTKFRIPIGSQLFVYNSQTERILGGYNEKNNKNEGLHPGFSTNICAGTSFYSSKYSG